MKNVNATSFGLSIKVCSLVFATFLLLTNLPVMAQHDMSNMPGINKPKATTRKKKTTRKKRTAKKHDMGNMAGMNMSGMKMPGMHRRKAASRRKKAPAQKNSANKKPMGNMPGMSMPAQPSSPKQSAAPQ